MAHGLLQYLGSIEKSITTIIVDPEPGNKRAIGCYSKTGFTVVGEYQAPWGPAILMRYDIKKGS